jgi:hypothetical protein|tara:strand:+ start:986 stop:1129 length:144 start_codon:yes stop_codon:yes gene_type:complete
MKKGLKLTMEDTIPGIEIKPAKVKNIDQSMPITAKVKMGSAGTKLKG